MDMKIFQLGPERYLLMTGLAFVFFQVGFFIEIDQMLRFAFVEKYSVRADEFESVPFLGVMLGGDHDAAVGAQVFGDDLYGRRGDDADIDDIDVVKRETFVDSFAQMRHGEAGVVTQDDFAAGGFADIFAEGDGETQGDIVGESVIVNSADTGNGYFEWHVVLPFFGRVISYN